MTGQEVHDYLVRRGFKRDDKDTEIYEALTDAVQEMRRRFGFGEAEVEKLTTTTISSLGTFKIPIESDLGLLVGIVHEDSNVGTPLNKLTKAQYDKKYPYVNVDPTFTGYPRDFCIFAGQIYIGPIPDSIAYRYRLSYSSNGGAVISSTSLVPFSAEYRDLLVNNALSRLYLDLDEKDTAQGYLAKFENDFVLAVRRERMNKSEGTFAMEYRGI